MHELPGDVSDANALDPASLGFMCGIEIHQQLATGKLHSRQAGQLHDVTIDTLPQSWPQFSRRLRATSGEGGGVDVAARFESRRRRTFIYAQSPNSGLVELDDAPPLGHDEDALDISLMIADMLSMKPIPLLQAMRKTVVDGSNTSGFQRTTLVATDGVLLLDEGNIGIDVLCLEEDSARKLEARTTDAGEEVVWNLDRLGIPLVELATAPDIKNPEHAKTTALTLGTLLRDTRRVRRGLGSIRQDLNVSIGSGDRVEIKGCQDLSWIPRIIYLEMARQLHFYRLSNELRGLMQLPQLPDDRRNTDKTVEAEVAKAVAEKIPLKINDVSTLFSGSTSKMISESLDSGAVMLAVSLPLLAGKLGVKQMDKEGAQMPRLGRELAGAAKLAGVKGIFHSDELPAYGISEEEVRQTKKSLNLDEKDAFVLCIAPKWQAELALESVIMRARVAWHRIPQEVRNVVVKKGAPEDGTTSPMRPLPGSARMYPETDIAPVTLTAERWRKISANPPLRGAERAARLAATNLSEDQAKQILARELDDILISGVEGSAGFPAVSGKAFATILLMGLDGIPNNLLNAMIYLREVDAIARDSEETLARDLLDGGAWKEQMNQKSKVAFLDIASQRAVELGLEPADAGALQSLIESLVAERLDFVKERGMGAIGPLMGMVMAQAKGADGKEVSTILRQVISDNT